MEDGISYSKGGTTFTGDGIQFYRATVLAASLALYAKTGMIPTRGVTITKMLAMASEITKKKYKRGQAKVAAADVKLWAQELKAALPTEVKE